MGYPSPYFLASIEVRASKDGAGTRRCGSSTRTWAALKRRYDTQSARGREHGPRQVRQCGAARARPATKFLIFGGTACRPPGVLRLSRFIYSLDRLRYPLGRRGGRQAAAARPSPHRQFHDPQQLGSVSSQLIATTGSLCVMPFYMPSQHVKEGHAAAHVAAPPVPASK